MLVAMSKVQIVGRKPEVEPILGSSLRDGVARAGQRRTRSRPFSSRRSPARTSAPRVAASCTSCLLELDGLLTLAGDSDATIPATEAASPADVSRELKTLMPLVEPLAARIEDLRTESAVLPRYIEPLRRLLPLVPELAELDESEIQALQLQAVALVLNTGDETIVDVLREALRSRPRRSLRARGGPRRLRLDRLRDRDSAERGRGGASRPRPRTRPSPSLAVSLRESLVPGRSQQPWRADCARFRPSSTGRRSSCTRCLRRALRHGEQRAADSWPTSNSSKRWRRPGRQIARS